MTTMTMEMTELKQALGATWNTGDYDIMARDLEQSAEEFIGRFQVPPNSTLLDVACGSGQIALPAARAGAQVTGVDIAPNSIAKARARAAMEGLDIAFDVDDVEALPYEDETFDTVVTLIGAMFAPRPERVVAELERVCKPGGRVIMGNWTPGGFIGLMFNVVAKCAPPSPLMPSPLQWGVEDIVRERLGGGFEEVVVTPRMHTFRYPFPPSEVVDLYASYFGPIMKALAKLDQLERCALRNELERLWAEFNRSTDGGTYVEAEILEVVAVRKRTA